MSKDRFQCKRVGVKMDSAIREPSKDKELLGAVVLPFLTCLSEARPLEISELGERLKVELESLSDPI